MPAASGASTDQPAGVAPEAPAVSAVATTDAAMIFGPFHFDNLIMTRLTPDNYLFWRAKEEEEEEEEEKNKSRCRARVIAWFLDDQRERWLKLPGEPAAHPQATSRRPSAPTHSHHWLLASNDDANFIQDEMEVMNGFLRHLARTQQLTPSGGQRGGDEEVQVWVRQVRDLASDSRDCINLYRHTSPRRATGLLRYMQMPWFLGGCATIPSRSTIAKRIRELKVRVQEAGERRLRYGIAVPPPPAIMKASTTMAMDSRRPPLRSVQESEDYDDDDDERGAFRRALVDAEPNILKESAAELTAWLGKKGDGDEARGRPFKLNVILAPDDAEGTGLAQQVYQDPSVSGGFNVKIFHDLLCQLLPDQNQDVLDDTSSDNMKLLWSIRGRLEGRRVLIVLDDLDDYPGMWDQIRIALNFISLPAGKIKTCVVPPPVHRLITEVAEEENVISVGSMICNAHLGDSKRCLGSLPASSQLLLLKVLDLEGCKGLEKRHLNNICKLFMLKYLSLRNTDVSVLPRQIHRLQQLETLDIRQTKIQAFPTDFAKLLMLKHLLAGHADFSPVKDTINSKESFSTPRMPHGIGAMRGNLEILSHVQVSGSGSESMLMDVGQLVKGADVAFHVGGETIAAHQWVLAARSPILKAAAEAELLGVPEREKKTPTATVASRTTAFTLRCDITVTELRARETEDRDFTDLLWKEGADVAFHVGGETIVAHRWVLAARSPILKAAAEAELLGMSEREKKKKTPMATIRIDDMEAKVFKALLHYIYTNALPDEMDKGDGAATAMAHGLLEAADRYKMERLKMFLKNRNKLYICLLSALQLYLAFPLQRL
ncbi:BTB/POZ and MATH domain-containing protein 1 [Triticum urartu]|uniref:BTB/POZ and MATH domain-containing protein 1 n=1 Tax=Triticum urartu TaxID=4572 RepID=M8A7Q4_TRIUA|nr:BTB/POZ and MATH domain-containing protein 1 [Triticum urartu]